MKEAYFNVSLNKKHVGYFLADAWHNAQKKASSHYKREFGEDVHWHDFNATYVPSKMLSDLNLSLPSEGATNETGGVENEEEGVSGEDCLQ